MNNIIEVIGLNKSYSSQADVLKNINLDIRENTFTVLLGQSGSGKSTFLNIICDLMTPTSGETLICGEKIHQLGEKKLAEIRRNRISNIYQDYMLISELTVRENIMLGKGRDNIEIFKLAEGLGLDSLLDKYPSQLSGGQRQRTAIARAVIKKPEILF